jgi:4-hydroxy-3-methylbut-2-enyl diphosphate reductase
VRFLDTVCKPTKERQTAAIDISRQSDVVVVVGGCSSNNTRELVTTCGRYCARVHHVQTDADVRDEWFDGANVVGLTAGTSTPDDVIDRVEARIRLRADASAGQVRLCADASAAASIGSAPDGRMRPRSIPHPPLTPRV